MKPTPECFPCFLRQALIAARLSTGSEMLQTRVQRMAAGYLAKADWRQNPPRIASDIFKKAYAVLEDPDPYRKVKKEYNRKVRALYPDLERLMKTSKNRLETALRLALAGNIIDFGILETIDLMGALHATLRLSVRRPVIDGITRRISTARSIFHIADNAGEIGFDFFLLREMRRLNPAAELVLGVRKAPVINDATRSDARYFGLEKLARIVDSGGNMVGTHLSFSSAPFTAAFQKADLIVAKGQANWESLEDLGDPRLLFLLKAKCPVVARALDVPLNEAVITPCTACKPGRKKVD